MPSEVKVSCPGCGSKQPKRQDDSIYWCTRCRCQFDADISEGGDYSDHNPAARLERAERQQERGRKAGRR